LPWQQGSFIKKISMTLNCLTLKAPCLMQESQLYLLYKPSYNHFCDKIRSHGNRGQSEVNFNATIKFSGHDFLKRVRYFGDQKLFCVILDELIMWALVKPKSLARQINNLFPVWLKKYTVTYSHAFKPIAKYGEDWMKMLFLDVKPVYGAKTRKFGCRACAQSTFVFCHKRTWPWKSPQLSVYQIWWKLVKTCAR